MCQKKDSQLLFVRKKTVNCYTSGKKVCDISNIFAGPTRFFKSDSAK